MIIKKY